MLLPCFSLAQKNGIYASANLVLDGVLPIKENMSNSATGVGSGLVQLHFTGGAMFNNRLGVFAGMGVDALFFDIKDKTSTLDRKFVMEANYMSFPLYLRYSTYRDRRVNYFITTGANFSFITDASLKYLNGDIEMYKMYYSGYMNKFLLYAKLGGGANIALGGRVSIDAALDCQASPIDVFNDDYEKDYYPLAIGVKLGLNVLVSQ